MTGQHQVVKTLCTEKYNIFVTVYSSAQWVRQAWPAEPTTFLISMLLMEALQTVTTFI